MVVRKNCYGLWAVKKLLCNVSYKKAQSRLAETTMDKLLQSCKMYQKNSIIPMSAVDMQIGYKILSYSLIQYK
jgi:hypothetical protein